MKRWTHHHPCADCGQPQPCNGRTEQNYDGEPEWYCPAYREMRHDFICEDCHWKRVDAKAKAS